MKRLLVISAAQISKTLVAALLCITLLVDQAKSQSTFAPLDVRIIEKDGPVDVVRQSTRFPDSKGRIIKVGESSIFGVSDIASISLHYGFQEWYLRLYLTPRAADKIAMLKAENPKRSIAVILNGVMRAANNLSAFRDPPYLWLWASEENAADALPLLEEVFKIYRKR
jgi:hypothetical protein